MGKLIDFETAKLAKELGFNRETYAYYYTHGKAKTKLINLLGKCSKYCDHSICPGDIAIDHNSEGITSCSAPTQSDLQKWFRDVHKLSVEVIWSGNHSAGKNWVCCFYVMSRDLHFFRRCIKGMSYEDVLEEGLLLALQYLKTENETTIQTK